MPVVGKKKIFLPSFYIALVRTPHLPPNFAQFLVPLNLNKLDLRDYLKNAYGVEVLGVRSFITQQAVQRHKPGFRSTRYYRPKSIKKMTVELVRPFVYPPEPTDLEPWDKDLMAKLEAEFKAMSPNPLSYQEPKPEREKIKNIVQELAGEKGKKQTEEKEKEKEKRGGGTKDANPPEAT